MFVNVVWPYSVVVPSEFPVGLQHLDSHACWCDPIIEVDDDGEEMVLHKQVTWH